MKEKNLFQEKKECCGCGACMNICPRQAITMTADQYGFYYPEVNMDLCVDCHQCENVCVYQKAEKRTSWKETHVAVAINSDVRESASGGVFSGFARAVLEAGGVVYGCTLEQKNGMLYPRHICVSETSELIKLKGSKYIQSDLADTYQDVQKQLKEGKIVLFSGTPCQVAGLNGFLKKEYDNLYTLDIICHGVPSRQLFQDYIAFQEKETGKKIMDYRFRDKSSGWKLFGKMVYMDENGIKSERTFEPEESSYYQMFLDGYTYRENCYQCPYASDNRQGDITIGDYWCIDLVHPELLTENGGTLDESRGVSCMIVNREQGRKLLNQFGEGIRCWESTYEQASRYNRQLTSPSALKPERETVLSLYLEGYEKVEQWYQKRLKKIRLKRRIVAMVPRKVKVVLRPLLKR